MGLRADLTVRIDASALVGVLVDQLLSSSGSLTGISIPASAEDMASITTTTDQVSTTRISVSVGPLLETLTGILGEFPAVDDIVAPLTAAIELLELILERDLPATFTSLVEKLTAELEGNNDTNAIGVLMRVAELLTSAPESGVVRELLFLLLNRAGHNIPLEGSSLTEGVTALQASMNVLGGMMSLETLLTEGERLAGVVATRLERPKAEFEEQALVACLQGSGVTLAQFIAGIDVDNPSEVDAALAALRGLAARMDSLRLYLSEGMGFGEATLVYLDVEALIGRIDAAALLVRQADLAPLERVMRWLIDRLEPIVSIDLSQAPVQTLEALLSQLEAQVSDFAATLTAFDPTVLVAPLTDALNTVTATITDLTDIITSVTVAVQSALTQVKDAVAALPFDDIANAVRSALEPVTDALQAIEDLVDDVKAALETAVDEAIDVIGTAEGAIDGFRDEVKALFDGAAEFLEAVPIQQTIGQVGDKVKAFMAIVEKAQMKPYFDTAASAIDSAADVIEKVPFSLLPDSMADDVNALIQPIKATDAKQIEAEIEALLGIDPDGGGFALRPKLETAISGIQEKYDTLMEAIEGLDPRGQLQDLDQSFEDFAEKVREISPQVALEPIQQAIARVKEQIEAFSLDDVLAPLQAGFDQVLEALDRFNPTQLIVPIEERLDAAREQALDLIKIREWSGHLEMLKTKALELVDRLKTEGLDAAIVKLLRETQELLDRFPAMQPGSSLGTVISALLSGLGLRIQPRSFEVVLTWLGGESGTEALARKAARVGTLLRAARDAVAATDPAALAVQVTPLMQQVDAAIAGLDDSAAKTALAKVAERIDPTETLGDLAANRSRYLTALDAAVALTERLTGMRLSEVDVMVGRLKVSIDPVKALTSLLRQVLERIGITGLDLGIPQVFRNLLAVATPERLAGVAAPIFVALKDRIQALIDAVIQPLQDGIDQLIALAEAIDLTPLRESVDGIYQQARTELMALSPYALLGDVLTGFNEVKAAVVDFDPLADVLEALTALQEAVARVLEKLSLEALLETPLRVYDEILAALESLNLQALLEPVLDQLDNIAAQVDEGLDHTVEAFERLQDALPDDVGGGGGSVSVEVVL